MTLTPLNAIRERAEQARKLVEAATPGPWRDQSDANDQMYVECGAYEDETPGICSDHSRNWSLTEEDAAFIAASPTIVRELLDDIERLRTALELAMEQRNTMYGDPPAYPEIVEPERAAFDAALAAILEPKDPPRTNEKGDHERD